jgi:hypothetical protein
MFSYFRSLLFWPVGWMDGWMGVCTTGDHEKKGGLLLDLGVISIKPQAIPASYYPSASSPIPRLPASHPAIVEWRAMTVIEL